MSCCYLILFLVSCSTWVEYMFLKEFWGVFIVKITKLFQNTPSYQEKMVQKPYLFV